MDNRQSLLFGGLGVIGVGTGIALVVFAMRGPDAELTRPVAATETKQREAAAPVVRDAVTVTPEPAVETVDPVASETAPQVATHSRAPAIRTQPVGGSKPFPEMGDLAAIMVQGPVVTKDEARGALALVGADADAEVVWWLAINDDTLDAEVRKDLIEDLNEDGFSNKKRPGVVDLPLIEARIALIEELAGDAMDEANLEAFAEAYKDLWNMRERLAPQR